MAAVPPPGAAVGAIPPPPLPGAVAGPLPQQGGVIGAQAAFALTPALAVQGVIDYSSREGGRLFAAATKPLDDEKYGMDAEGMRGFLKAFGERAKDHAWDEDGNLSIPRLENPYDTDSLITNYGEITIGRIRHFDAMYIGTPTRAGQDNYMMYKCLMASLTKEAKNKVAAWESQYHIDGNCSANLLLKVIIRESHLDTNATTSNLRTQLSSLDSYIGTIGSDITMFHEYVKNLIEALAARGETSNDVMINLFKGYKQASDKAFVDYMGRKQERYDEGEELTVDSLMDFANNKFKNMSIQETWNAPSHEEEKILALQTEVQSLKKMAKKAKTGNDKKKPFDRNKGKSKDKKKENGKNTRPPLPDWFEIEPKKADLFRPRIWNKKEWYWCHPDTGGKCHGIYRRHKPKQCEGKAFKPGSPIKRKEGPSGKEDRKLKMAKALEVIAKSQEDDTDSE